MCARMNHRWGLAVLVIGIVAAFLLIAAWQLQMHPDEVLSYTSTDGDLAFTLDMQMSVKDNQAPLWFVSFWAWRQTVGDAEYTSRVFGVLAVMLAGGRSGGVLAQVLEGCPHRPGRAGQLYTSRRLGF